MTPVQTALLDLHHAARAAAEAGICGYWLDGKCESALAYHVKTALMEIDRLSAAAEALRQAAQPAAQAEAA